MNPVPHPIDGCARLDGASVTLRVCMPSVPRRILIGRVIWRRMGRWRWILFLGLWCKRVSLGDWLFGGGSLRLLMSKCTAIYWWLWKVSNNDDECLEQHPSFWQRTKKKNILHFDRRRRREMKVYREDETTLCWCTILLLTCLCRKKGGYYKVGHRVRWLVWGWMIVIVLNADFNYIKTNRLMQSFWISQFWYCIGDIFCLARCSRM